MTIWCRLCREPVVDGSQFCHRHRAQAALFSRAFAPAEGVTAAAEVTAGHAAPLPTASFTEAERAVAALTQTLTELLVSGEANKRQRWPVISIYYASETLLARAYFAIVPSSGKDPECTPLNINGTRLKEALTTGGIVHHVLVEQFEASVAALKTQQLDSLDVHFVTYAGVIAINRHRSGERDKNLATLIQTEQGFEVTTVEAVRPRLQHQRW